MYPNQPNGYPPQPGQQPQYPPQGTPQPQYGQQAPAPQPGPGGYPQQIFPQQHSSGHNPYEFIVQHENARATLFGGASMLQRVGIIGGLVVLLLIVAALGINAVKPKDSSTAELIALAQRQTEIVRVATDGATKASNQDVKNAAINAQLAVSSGENQTVAYLQAHGTKLNDKKLGLDHSAQTDTTLANALATSTYDSALVDNLESQMTTYQSNLTAAFNKTKSAQAKTMLQKQFNASKLLMTQLKAADTTPA